MYRLPDVSLLNPVLDLAVEADGAVGGTIQVLSTERPELHIVAQRGFRTPFLQHFRVVTAHDGSASGHALLDRRRIVINDIDLDPGYAPHRAAAVEAGYRAVIATPLIGHAGAIVGALSVYFARPHHPSLEVLSRVDLLGLLAARIIESSRLRTKIEDGAMARGLPLPSLPASALHAAVSTREMLTILRERGMDMAMGEAIVGEFDRLLPELRKFARIW
jgi:GAF domain-containing protein